MISERKIRRNIQYSQYLTPDFYNQDYFTTPKHKTNTYEFRENLFYTKTENRLKDAHFHFGQLVIKRNARLFQISLI